MSKVEANLIGKSFSQTNGVDNQELIKVNQQIRNHPIEIIGTKLRSSMRAMKKIN